MSGRIEIEYLSPALLAVRGPGSKGICEAVPYAIGPSWSGSRHCWLMHAAHAEAIEVLATAAGGSVAIIGGPVTTLTPVTRGNTSEAQAALW